MVLPYSTLTHSLAHTLSHPIPHLLPLPYYYWLTYLRRLAGHQPEQQCHQLLAHHDSCVDGRLLVRVGVRVRVRAGVRVGVKIRIGFRVGVRGAGGLGLE